MYDSQRRESTLAKYQIWVGGESPWSRSYTGEYGGAKLTDAQIARWLPDYGDVHPEEHEIDTEAWMEQISTFDDPTDPSDLPGYNDVTDGCFCYGAYTDQTFGVATEDDEVLYSWDYGEIERDEDVAGDDEYDGPIHTFIDDETHLEGVWIVYNSYSKGGWGTTIELPDDEEFDPRKLRFEIMNIEGFQDVVTGFSYDGVDYHDESDSDGKGIDYFAIVDGFFHRLF